MDNAKVAGLPKALTHRQARFVKAVLEGRSYAQAAREAGYSESVANCAGRKIAAKPEVQAALREAETQEARGWELTVTEKQMIENFRKLNGNPRLSGLIENLAEGDMRFALLRLRLLQWDCERIQRERQSDAGMEK